jgi:hypothetical protein
LVEKGPIVAAGELDLWESITDDHDPPSSGTVGLPGLLNLLNRKG